MTSVLARILNWLRAGYPERAPGPERVPLLALLRPTPLTEDQVDEVVHNLTAIGAPLMTEGQLDTEVIAACITDLTGHDAGPENVQRVANRLVACGSPEPAANDGADKR
jgi:hypothetical protein